MQQRSNPGFASGDLIVPAGFKSPFQKRRASALSKSNTVFVVDQLCPQKFEPQMLWTLSFLFPDPLDFHTRALPDALDIGS